MSPAPFWSMTCSTSWAGTVTTPSPSRRRPPRGPRVTTAKMPEFFEVRERRVQEVTWKSEQISVSLASSTSTSFVTSSRKSRRCRSTQNMSESESATIES